MQDARQLENARMLPMSAVEAARARLARHVRFRPGEVVALAVVGALLVVGAALAYVRARPTPAAELAPSPAPTVSAAGSGAMLVVHVVGAVRSPGVYRFPEGARVLEAVEAAGGLLPKAEQAAINLARPIADGEQIVVPRRGEPAAGGGVAGHPAAPSAAGSGAAGGKVNINSASASELDGLPGVGPVIAERIVQYREQHGPFRTVKDLMKVSGIGPKKFESVEAYVTV